jgi:hypothetical protein
MGKCVLGGYKGRIIKTFQKLKKEVILQNIIGKINMEN